MFNKIFSKKIVVPFFSGIGTVAIFEWLVFPGLTAADTIVNIFAGIIGFFTLVFVYYSLGFDKIISNYMNSDELVDSTELKEKEVDELCANEAEFEAKEEFQKLAGIGVPKPVKNEKVINGYKELADKWSKAGFPESDESIPVRITKITTIDTKFGSDKDPLASVPMSRVSNEAKQKMADIAKEDISKQLEEKTANIHPNDLNAIQTVLSSLDKMNDGDDTKSNTEIINDMIKAPLVKPKRKYTKKVKQ
jgi:hypothetical protein